MTKEDFRKLFLRAIEEAAVSAEKKFGETVPRSFIIELHAPGCPGRIVDVEEALDKLYLAEDRFYKIVDVAIVALAPEKAVIFARVSGHVPVAFEQTWDASELGPFKQIEPVRIEDRRAPLGGGSTG